MRAVIDTNVIVSGLLNPYGIPAEILRLLLAGEIILIYDSRIISEYQEVLSRSKFQFIIENIKILVKEIEVTGSLVLPVSLKFSLPDPDDNMLKNYVRASKYFHPPNLLYFTSVVDK